MSAVFSTLPYNAGFIFICKGNRQILEYFFLSVCICTCIPLHAHIKAVLQKTCFLAVHTNTEGLAVGYRALLA